MLAALRRGLHWLIPSSVDNPPLSLCVPEWSEPMAEQQAAIWWQVRRHTSMSAEQVVTVCQSIAYLDNHHIPGAMVECGAGTEWSAMAAALALLALESTQRELFLFDQFDRGGASLQDVKRALMLTRYPWEKLIFVPGNIEHNLDELAPEPIALLRLGAHAPGSASEHLYSRLAEGGVLIDAAGRMRIKRPQPQRVLEAA